MEVGRASGSLRESSVPSRRKRTTRPSPGSATQSVPAVGGDRQRGGRAQAGDLGAHRSVGIEERHVAARSVHRPDAAGQDRIGVERHDAGTVVDAGERSPRPAEIRSSVSPARSATQNPPSGAAQTATGSTAVESRRVTPTPNSTRATAPSRSATHTELFSGRSEIDDPDEGGIGIDDFPRVIDEMNGTGAGVGHPPSSGGAQRGQRTLQGVDCASARLRRGRGDARCPRRTR